VQRLAKRVQPCPKLVQPCFNFVSLIGILQLSGKASDRNESCLGLRQYQLGWIWLSNCQLGFHQHGERIANLQVGDQEIAAGTLRISRASRKVHRRISYVMMHREG
jgi:hypothetical protein